ncbi:zinc-binding dehydrogenase [Novosphingobium sp. KCTC 2891]|uniref:zinc-binding dehydrogenase n=1 Tax=Novosphingobium sp. KCTC 2891 TaxID=2989730 RepID=UPI00222392DE|nr:zinc-binding dehydrogenase [Novosphingobium sp. KCTC 2891]MCW1382466.1 zinc-binding dehydrogenase [Novosphingobium sp. KCTC 2891]
MSQVRGLQLLSTLEETGKLTVELVEQTLPDPTGHEVLIRVEAAPINPSDLGLLFGPADVENAEYSDGKIVAQMPEPGLRAMKARWGMAMPVGNEGAGTVIAAGDAPEAQALLGKVVTCIPGGMYAQYRVVDARECMVLNDGTSAEEGASAFVNPLTALSFVECMKREGHTGLVHTAAASNLGQMLVRICQEDNVPLVNIVRSPAQVAILKEIGAEHIVDSSAPTFLDDLAAALTATGATMAFDAIGGGKLVSQILTAMEQVANQGAAFSRYGSNSPKQAYIYGALDLSPTVLTRNFGFSWGVNGFLLMPFLQKIGEQNVERLRQRVRDGLKTTFASKYKARVSLQQALTREAALDYNARRTGEKYLILPN